MGKIQKGQRVNHEYLGNGTFLKHLSTFFSDKFIMSLVEFDKTPNIKYNSGENPCAVFTRKLTKIRKGK